MKFVVCTVLVANVLPVAGCRRTPAPVEPAGPSLPAAGVVTLPVGSPLLKQIGCAPARILDLPNDEVVAPGKIEANPTRVSKIVLPVTGRIAAVLVRPGDTVARDQALLTVQSPDADAAISTYLSAQAATLQTRSALTTAAADAERAADLFEHDAIARKDRQAADSALAQAQAADDQARAAREQSLRRLAVLGLEAGDFDQRVVVRSPLAGKVLDLAAVPGEYRTDTSVPVVTVVDLASVWVASQVPESAIRFIRPGEQVQVNLVAYPDETFIGRVARIADVVDPQTRTVKVQAELDNPVGRLRPEMYGTIHHVERTATTIVVPVGAVVQHERESVLFVQTAPGRFEQRTVTTGKRAGDVVRIAAGIAAGEIVAVDGVMLLDGLLKRT